ncbi:unannotated protein [freshwater metagenome]|uniref:Unannotated protein n=1 Tax=freshwater metagenome TaxID=449393 RepID=A0A6J6F252_9ZZZZ
MTCVAPQSAVHHLTSRCGVGSKRLQLGIADGLECETNRPHDGAEDEWEHPPRSLRGDADTELQRKRDNPHEDPLEHVHSSETDEPELCTVFLAHRLVAVVLAMAKVSNEEVQRQSHSPNRDKGKQHSRAQCVNVLMHRGERHPAHNDESERPNRVNDRRVSKKQAHHPRRNHDDGDCERGPREDRPMHEQNPTGWSFVPLVFRRVSDRLPHATRRQGSKCPRHIPHR